MLDFWASGSIQILVGSINEILSIVQFGQGASKLQGRKVGSQKKLRHFGFKAMFFASLFSESLLSERSGFDPRRGQTLKACNFAALWSGKTYSTSFERSKLYLLGKMEKKRFGAFLKHFSLAQNTLKSYHKWPKSRFNLQGTVKGF